MLERQLDLKAIKEFSRAMNSLTETMAIVLLPNLLVFGKALLNVYEIMEQEAAKHGMTVEEWIKCLREIKEDA